MKFGVVIFPGSNCDQDLIHIVRNGLKQEVVELWHKDHTLQGCDFVFLPGGFSYGDYLRSGAIARFSPIMQEVLEFADKGGFVMGICNGFQILTEAKLLPGALLQNTNNQFICKNVHLKVETDDSVITTKFKIGDHVTVPIAHGEGNFHCDATTLQSMKDNNQILFRYCNENGIVTPESNPNGSLENIAGICNKGRNVYGMMPHPERAADAILGNTDGRKILDSILNAVIA
jgi:phosphoribosylformylglycinamidine synthase subunit PurQ / glutaminase